MGTDLRRTRIALAGRRNASLRDIGALLDLISRLHTCSEGPTHRRQILLQELTRLLDADSGAILLLNNAFNPRGALREPIQVSGIVQVGPLAAQLAAATDPIDPALHRLLVRRCTNLKNTVTMIRTSIIDDDEWNAAPLVRELTARCVSLDSIYSVTPFTGGVAAVTLYRTRGDALFERRDTLMLHLIHSHVPWLFDDRSPHDSAQFAALSPPQQQVLRSLLAGRSEKQVAAHVGRSPHTVHTHVKSIYRAFRVGSRAELLSKFVAQT